MVSCKEWKILYFLSYQEYDYVLCKERMYCEWTGSAMGLHYCARKLWSRFCIYIQCLHRLWAALLVKFRPGTPIHSLPAHYCGSLGVVAISESKLMFSYRFQWTNVEKWNVASVSAFGNFMCHVRFSKCQVGRIVLEWRICSIRNVSGQSAFFKWQFIMNEMSNQIFLCYKCKLKTWINQIPSHVAISIAGPWIM